jgi:uncharacterized oxidoreductase
MRLTGNTILITGGGSGIGLALGKAFARHGNQVVAAGRNPEKLKVADTNGLSTVRVDISDAASVQALAMTVLRKLPRTNVVIHNAALCKPQDFIDGGSEQIREETIATNFLGPMRLTDAILPHLLQQEQAAIMIVSSGLGFVPSARYPAYSATKAALHSYAQSLRFQLKDTAIEVIELVPPYVQTELGGPAQATDPYAMPLEGFVAEVFDILEQNPRVEEILVTRVHGHRFAAESGRESYEAFFRQYNSRFTFGSAPRETLSASVPER